jgi:hypothetical protein
MSSRLPTIWRRVASSQRHHGVPRLDIVHGACDDGARLIGRPAMGRATVVQRVPVRRDAEIFKMRGWIRRIGDRALREADETVTRFRERRFIDPTLARAGLRHRRPRIPGGAEAAALALDAVRRAARDSPERVATAVPSPGGPREGPRASVRTRRSDPR